MTNKELEHANEIKSSLDTIWKLQRIFSRPYPTVVYNNKKKRLVGFRDTDNEVCLVSVDDKTRELIKEAMVNLLDKRYEELSEELKNM